MCIAAAGLVLSIINGPTLQSPDEQSNSILIKWAESAAKERVAEQRNASGDWTGVHEMDFERANDGPVGALSRLTSFLEGKDLPLRRAAAQVVCLIRPSMQHVQWLAFRSKELQVAARYVLDQDPETARNATNSFIQLCGGYWDRWEEVQSMWVNSLATAKPPQTRMLARLFAFTTVPMKGALPGLNKLFHSRDSATAMAAKFAIGRASLVMPDETREFLLKPCAAESRSTCRQGFKDLEAFALTLWGSPDLFSVRQPGFEPGLQMNWIQATINLDQGTAFGQGSTPRAWHAELLRMVESGLKSGDAPVQISCAKVLVALRDEVDRPYRSGTYFDVRNADADVADFARLSRMAVETVGAKDPLLAKKLLPDPKGGLRIRVVY